MVVGTAVGRTLKRIVVEGVVVSVSLHVNRNDFAASCIVELGGDEVKQVLRSLCGRSANFPTLTKGQRRAPGNSGEDCAACKVDEDSIESRYEDSEVERLE